MGILVSKSAALATAALSAALVLLDGCGGSSATPPKAAPSGSSTPSTPSTPSTLSSTSQPTASSPAPQPAATEVNPPGDIPDDQVFVSYRPPGAAFTVRVPEGWARSSAGGSVTFTDKLNSITIASAPAATKPTAGSVRASELPMVAQQGRNYRARAVTVIRRKSGPAVLATYLQDSRPDPVTNKVVRDAVEHYSFWHNGTEAVLSLSGPKGADNVDPWRIVSDSLTWH
jgi:hypothetical protein